MKIKLKNLKRNLLLKLKKTKINLEKENEIFYYKL